jgi:hypothetical protein
MPKAAKAAPAMTKPVAVRAGFDSTPGGVTYRQTRSRQVRPFRLSRRDSTRQKTADRAAGRRASANTPTEWVTLPSRHIRRLAAFLPVSIQLPVPSGSPSEWETCTRSIFVTRIKILQTKMTEIMTGTGRNGFHPFWNPIPSIGLTHMLGFSTMCALVDDPV